MSQSSGDTEERILTIERAIWGLDSQRRGVQTRAIALEQQLMAAWGYLGTPPPPPPPPPRQNIALCGGLLCQLSLPFTDSIYGSGTLVWNGSNAWVACLSGLAYGGGFGCTAQTIALHYNLSNSGSLTLGWASSGVTTCPIASTCSTTVNVSGLTIVSTNCSSVPKTATFTLSGSVQTIRFPNASETITVQLLT